MGNLINIYELTLRKNFKIMHSTSPKLKTKERISLTINKQLYEQFRKVSEKEMRPRSRIVESAINRYVQSRV